MLKMPHPLQVLGVSVGIVAEDALTAVFVEGVGIVRVAVDREFNGFLGVFIGKKAI
jgi:hypothetical protein